MGIIYIEGLIHTRGFIPFGNNIGLGLKTETNIKGWRGYWNLIMVKPQGLFIPKQLTCKRGF